MRTAQRRGEDALPPKNCPESQGKARTQNSVSTATTSCYPCTHPPILCLPQFPTQSPDFGQPQLGAGWSCGQCPARCLAPARTERAVPVLGQLDLSDLLQGGLEHYYPPDTQVNTRYESPRAQEVTLPQQRMKGAGRNDLLQHT